MTREEEQQITDLIKMGMNGVTKFFAVAKADDMSAREVLVAVTLMQVIVCKSEHIGLDETVTLFRTLWPAIETFPSDTH